MLAGVNLRQILRSKRYEKTFYVEKRKLGKLKTIIFCFLWKIKAYPEYSQSLRTFWGCVILCDHLY